MSLENSSEVKVRKRKFEVDKETTLLPVLKKNKISGEENTISTPGVSGDEISKYVSEDVDTCQEEYHQVGKLSNLDANSSHFRCVDQPILFPKWLNLKNALVRKGPFSHPDFQPSILAFEQLKKIKVLVVGAGGLGCEILKNLALMGFANLHVIDMDKVDLSNLNRQFLFRRQDIGRPKADVAADFIKKRLKGCFIQPYYNKIEDFDQQFYQSFNIVLCGLDSIFARHWINGMLLSLLSYDENKYELDYSTIIPLLDGGTEGFKGNARIVLPGVTSCIDCAKDLYPPQTKYQLCTLANNPRLPEHCVEYVKMILWPKDNPWSKSTQLDADDPCHLKWVYEMSSEIATRYGIIGLTYGLVQGVIKNIIPAVASTNAVIAAACVTEAFKIATNSYLPLSNHLIFNDVDGIYSHSFEFQRKKDCLSCSVFPNVIEENLEITLNDLIKSISLNTSCKFYNPSVTANIKGNHKTLYMSSVQAIEERTRSNLNKTLHELGFQDGTEFIVADKAFPNSLTFQLRKPKT